MYQMDTFSQEILQKRHAVGVEKGQLLRDRVEALADALGKRVGDVKRQQRLHNVI